MKQDYEIVYFKHSELGKGLPFAFVNSDELGVNKDIFVPSLRDFHVIFWIKKGSGIYVVDFEEYKFRSNTIILLSKHQLHYFKPFERSKVEMQAIVFKPEFIYRHQSDMRHLFRFSMGCHQEGVQIMSLRKSEADFLEMLSGQMNYVYENWKDETREKSFYHWLSLFLIQCEEIQISKGFDARQQVDQETAMLLKFNELLEENFKHEYKVEFYVNSLNTTIKGLSHLTKKKFKLSPKAVLDERRILEIKRLLKGTDKASKSIAYELGFEDPTNMFKYFKKHTGMTPNEFKTTN